jgi:beta-phosphoglucomutase-like phosphatase (HAD superfamily)
VKHYDPAYMSQESPTSPISFTRRQARAAKLARPIRPEKTFLIEDAPAGLQAGRAARCRIAAVTSSYPRAALAEADIIVDSLAELSVDRLKKQL